MSSAHFEHFARAAVYHNAHIVVSTVHAPNNIHVSTSRHAFYFIHTLVACDSRGSTLAYLVAVTASITIHAPVIVWIDLNPVGPDFDALGLCWNGRHKRCHHHRCDCRKLIHGTYLYLAPAVQMNGQTRLWFLLARSTLYNGAIY